MKPLFSILLVTPIFAALAITFNSKGSSLVSSLKGPSDIPSKAPPVSFTFNAFGDSGWSQSHNRLSSAHSSFKRHYLKMDPGSSLRADLNYINWETSVGKTCNQFWSSPSPSHYAFLTHPSELSDAVSLGFNVVGLANNHSYDCLASIEGNGPLQSLSHLSKIQSNYNNEGTALLFSGLFRKPSKAVASGVMKVKNGHVPVSFLSAYVGGNQSHCRYISCAFALEKYAPELKKKKGLRILALHSWNRESHTQLKALLQSWLSRDLVDIAIGSGPHVAESVSIVKTPKGDKVKATSLGNFIHPGLGYQPNNIVLRTGWTYLPESNQLELESLLAVKVSCNGERCVMGGSRKYK